MRIVVHPHLQQKGIGTHLLEHVRRDCIHRHYHFIGAMFAADLSPFGFGKKILSVCVWV